MRRRRRNPADGAACGPSHAVAVHVLRAATIYFALVFGLGFALGVVRQLVVAPRVGAATAELLEMPVMVAAIVVVARLRQRRTSDLDSRRQLLVGGVALLLLLGAECLLGLALRDRSPTATLFDRDPVNAAAWYGALLVFAAMPWCWSRRAPPQRSPGVRAPAPDRAEASGRDSADRQGPAGARR